MMRVIYGLPTLVGESLKGAEVGRHGGRGPQESGVQARWTEHTSCMVGFICMLSLYLRI